jgi:hypothetical protein
MYRVLVVGLVILRGQVALPAFDLVMILPAAYLP